MESLSRRFTRAFSRPVTLAEKRRGRIGTIAGTTATPICRERGTSYGGWLNNVTPGQGSCALWIRSGAYGSSGTIAEPYTYGQKFPHPHIHTHFRNGASLAEAFWQSIVWTQEILPLGDPLMQPYAVSPVVTVSSPATDGTTVSGNLTIAANATVGTVTSPTTMAPTSLETNLDIAVDGHVVNIGAGGETISATRTGGGFTLDTTTLADGYHEIRVIAYNNNSVRTQGETTRTIFVNNLGQSVALSGSSTVDYAGGSASFSVTPSGISTATSLTLQANGRKLATLPVGGGTTAVSSLAFGYQGTTTVYAVACLNNGKQVWSAPWNVAVSWTPKAPQSVTLSTNSMAMVKYFANTKVGGFNWDTTPPTATVGMTTNLIFNTQTMPTIAPSDYTTAPAYQADTYFWAATTNLYEFCSIGLAGSGFSYTSNFTVRVDGQLLGNVTPGYNVPVRLAAGAHLLTMRFYAVNTNFNQTVFLRDVNDVASSGCQDEYAVFPLSSLFTTTNLTPPTIFSGPAAISSLSSNKVSFSVGASTVNPGPLTYTWSKADGPIQGAVTFSANGTTAAANTVATFGMAGNYLLQIVVNDGAAVTIAQVPVSVNNNGGVSIVLTPATASVPANKAQIYQAAVTDVFGNSVPFEGSSVSWSVTDDGDGVTYNWIQTGGPAPITFSTNNCAAAATSRATYAQLGTYNFQVIATDADGASVTSAVQTVTITSPTLIQLVIAPNPAIVQTNSTLQFTAHAYDQFGGEMPASVLTNVWESTDIGTISTNGLLTAASSNNYDPYGVDDYANNEFYDWSPTTVTNLPVVALPSFNPVAGTYATATNIAVTTTTAGATIYYTTDGSVPTTSNRILYNVPVPITNGLTKVKLAG